MCSIHGYLEQFLYSMFPHCSKALTTHAHLPSCITAFPVTFPGLSEHAITVPFSSVEAFTVTVEV